MGPLGLPELVVILILALLIFGGTRLAGLGKASGRAIREFKEETKGLKEERKEELAAKQPSDAGSAAATEVAEAEIVDPDSAKN